MSSVAFERLDRLLPTRETGPVPGNYRLRENVKNGLADRLHRLPGKSSMMADLWLIPGRDLLLGWVWVKSLFTSRITWRGNTFDVDAEGVMRRLS